MKKRVLEALQEGEVDGKRVAGRDMEAAYQQKKKNDLCVKCGKPGHTATLHRKHTCPYLQEKGSQRTSQNAADG